MTKAVQNQFFLLTIKSEFSDNADNHLFKSKAKAISYAVNDIADTYEGVTKKEIRESLKEDDEYYGEEVSAKIEPITVEE